MISVEKYNSGDFKSMTDVHSGLWLMNLDKTPYHLGFSTRGKYFSLKFNSKDFSLSTNDILDKVNRLNLKVMFIPLMVNYAPERVEKAFEKFTSCLVDGCSCIQPILDLIELSGENWVLFDLLDALEQAGQLEKGYVLNAPSDFQFVEYTHKEVEENLLSAQV